MTFFSNGQTIINSTAQSNSAKSSTTIISTKTIPKSNTKTIPQKTYNPKDQFYVTEAKLNRDIKLKEASDICRVLYNGDEFFIKIKEEQVMI